MSGDRSPAVRESALRRARLAGRLLVLSPVLVVALHLVVLLADPGQGTPPDQTTGDPHGYGVIFGTLLAFLALPVLLLLALWGGRFVRRRRRGGAAVLAVLAVVALLQCLLVLLGPLTLVPAAVTTLVTVIAALWGLVAIACAVMAVGGWRALSARA